MAGEEKVCLNAGASDLALDAQKLIALQLKLSLQSLRLILPDGQLLTTICNENPGCTLEDLSDTRKRRRIE
jgi:predicted RNA-binding Zn ribbon-like protein